MSGETPGGSPDETTKAPAAPSESVDGVADAAEVTPDAADALEAAEGDLSERRDLREALPKTEAIRQDDEAAEAVIDQLSAAKTAMEGKLTALEKTAHTNDTLGFPTLVRLKVKEGRTELTEVGGVVSAKLTEVKQLRDDEKYSEATTALGAAKKAIIDSLNKVQIVSNKEPKLSAETRAALEDMRNTATDWNSDLVGAFIEREDTLVAVSAALDIPAVTVADAKVPTPSADSTTPDTPDAASTAPGGIAESSESVKRSLMSKLGDPFGPALSNLGVAIDGFDVGTDWFYLSGAHDKRVAARDNAKQQVSGLGTKWQAGIASIRQMVSGATKPKDYADAKAQLSLFLTDTIRPDLTTIRGQLTSVPDSATLVASFDQAEQAAAAQVETLGGLMDQAGAAIEAEVSVAEAQAEAARVAEAERVAAAPAVTPPPDAVTEAPEEEFDIEAMHAGLVEVADNIREGMVKEDWGLVVAAAMKGFGLLLAAMEMADGDIGKIGDMLTEFLSDEGVEMKFDNPLDLINGLFQAMNPNSDIVQQIAGTSLRDLYSFYEGAADGDIDIPGNVLTGLKAFRADKPEEYKAIMKRIFDDHGGKEGIEGDKG
ncbi:MAG: hypothetical protein Q8P27_01435, partial [Candidatus Peregrinibacteria bacterium]|nr:hypothetical protein [Candidatus Peregrinibacteria bacterium]